MRNLILIVEDDLSIRVMVKIALESAEFIVVEASDVKEAELKIVAKIPHLILLDWMLPGISGIEFAKKLKSNALTKEIPLIMLTAHNDEDKKIKGLTIGADDYVTKPFSLRELVARIKTVLRRSHSLTTEGLLQTKHISLNTNTQQVEINHQRIDLTAQTYRLLYFFMSHPERVYTRDQLLNHVWGGETDIDIRTVDVQIRRLRHVLKKYGVSDCIHTVRGSGYKFSN